MAVEVYGHLIGGGRRASRLRFGVDELMGQTAKRTTTITVDLGELKAS